MGQGGITAVLLVLLLAAANAPFISPRLLVLGPLRPQRGVALRLLELLLLGGLWLAVALALEARLGQRHPQGWAFYAVLACLLLTFAFPGFVWRYLRRQRDAAA